VAGVEQAVEPRYVAVVGMHLLVALTFAALATWNALNGDIVNATLQGVLAVLVLFLGIGITRIA
jgi:hypothetical protein